MFKPSRPGLVQDPAVRKMQILRTVLGLFAVVWIMFTYQVVADTDALVNDRTDQFELSMNVMAGTFPVVVGIFIAASRPPNRRLYLKRALKPFGSLLALFGTVVGVLLLAASPLVDGKAPTEPSPRAYAVLALLLFLCLWVLPFLLYGFAMSLLYVFRTADVHEVLSPILVIILAWEVGLVDLFSDDYDHVSLAVRAALVLGGPVSVTAVSLWELRRLRTRHGLTLRGALLR
ncbi:hypothetical protein [Streptomyces sp. NPDC058045]|uniref:hypothetical protein n=1 Tax=Streptomyces sp. NPDC058045 TaxID=3346311 RepID=UPI0036ED7ED0